MNIIWQKPDGFAIITHLAPGHAETPEQHAAALKVQGAIPADFDAVGFAAQHPVNDEYYGAWKWDGAKVIHDMVKARDIHRDRLRQGRKDKLAALDVEYQRADEAGDAAMKKIVAAEKQKLRDITAHPDIEAAPTVEHLKGVKLGLL